MEEKLTKAQLKEQRKQEKQAWETHMERQQHMAGVKKFGIWLIVLVVLAASIWGLIFLVNVPTTPTAVSLTAPKITNQDITTGPKDAKVTLIEYADFQCPACGAYHPIVKQLLKDFNGKILFVYRFFPLTTVHKNAFASASVAYAALQQGKFWEMHDMLFEHQSDWAEVIDPTNIFLGFAKSLGLDVTKLQSDMQAQSTKDFINTEANAGTAIGINATPTFFINGKSIQNPPGYDAFKQHITDALAAK